MIDLKKMIRRFEKLDGRHFLTIFRMVDGRDQLITTTPIRCWLDLKSQDNPDLGTVQAQPIIKTLDVYTFPWVDVRNGDFLIVQKTNQGGEIIGTWRGQGGDPFVYQPYQVVNMRMAKISEDESEVTPPPPPPLPNESSIYLHFLNEFHLRIHEMIIHRAEIGEPLEIPYLVLDGYEFDHAILNGERRDDPAGISFTPREGFYNVEFIYLGSKMPTAIKVLLNGAYTRANGTAANGLHLYRNMPITWLGESADGIVSVEVTDGLRFQHSTSFRWHTIGVGDVLVLYPFLDKFYLVMSADGNVLQLTPYDASEAEQNAYIYRF